MKTPGRALIAILFFLVPALAAGWGMVYADQRPQLGLDLVGGVSMTLTAPEGTDPEVLDRTVEIIRERVDAFGVAEPDITRQADLNIQVQIPATDEEEGAQQQRLLDLVGRTAQLEFRIVQEMIPPGTPEYEQVEVTGPEEEEVPGEEPAAEETPDPAAEEEAPEDEADQDPLDEGDTVVFLGSGEDLTKYRLGPVLMRGEALSRATAQLGDAIGGGGGGWRIAFELTPAGRDRFAEITRENLNQQLAIVLDRRVESAPTIQSEIPDGRGEITGDFTEREAKDLALVLRVGALPVELEPSEVRTVSPTLGRESLRQGLLAGLVGLAGLAVYLLFYYRLLGVVALFGMAVWAALALGVIAVLGRLAGYSLTLAGVAGLVVSIGIAADSNIVFYERLKDGLRQGKTFRAAVQPAFRRAWKTIIAADIVTISAAIILYLLAVGGVRGFALTLGLATFLDMFVIYFVVAPTVFLVSRSRRLSEMRGVGLLSGPVGRAATQSAGGGR